MNTVVKSESTMRDVCGKIFDSSVCTTTPIKRQRLEDNRFSLFSSPASTSSTFLPDDTGNTNMLCSDRCVNWLIIITKKRIIIILFILNCYLCSETPIFSDSLYKFLVFEDNLLQFKTCTM